MSRRDNLAAIIGEHIDKCRTNEEIADAVLAEPQIKAALELAEAELKGTCWYCGQLSTLDYLETGDMLCLACREKKANKAKEEA